MKKTPSFWAQNPGNSSAQPYSQAGPKLARRLGPARCARAGRTQAATWAWADKVALPRAPAWAASRPVHLAPLDLIGSDWTADRSFQMNKNPSTAVSS